MLFNQYKCPQCGKPWKNRTVQFRHECGYELRVLGCPQCMNVIDDDDIITKKRNIYLNKQGKIDPGCECQCGYVQLDIPVREYIHLYCNILFSLPKDLPGKYEWFLREYRFFQLQKEMYDNFFDHSKLNHNHYKIIRFFAFLNPESEESKQYFLKEYGEPYDELYRKTHDETELQKLRELAIQKKQEIAQREQARQEALHPTPKCPACGSTRLTKISSLTKAAKISAFGIYGAGDVGKTYKCNNCGVKF